MRKNKTVPIYEPPAEDTFEELPAEDIQEELYEDETDELYEDMSEDMPETPADDTSEQPFTFNYSIQILRFVLMFFMCINLFGLPKLLDGGEQTLCGFVPIAFFIISGFLVLREDEDRDARIVRAIIRTAIAFVALVVAYGVINYFYYKALGASILPAFRLKRLWFSFLVLNVWPFDIGGAIWYVQSLLYAYIIIFFLNKLKLLKHDWKISAVLILITVLTGELSGIIPWSAIGFDYIPGNFLTRALPYVLLGAFLYRKKAVWEHIHIAFLALGILAGVLMMCAEAYILGKFNLSGYYGHLLGMPVVAVSVCLFAFREKANKQSEDVEPIFPRWQINCIYYFCQPVSAVLALLMSLFGRESADLFTFLGFIIFAISFILALIVGKIVKAFKKKPE